MTPGASHQIGSLDELREHYRPPGSGALAKQLDYLFAYHAPVLFADDKAKTIFTGLRPERVDQAVRLSDVRHQIFDHDVLMRGRVTYPDKLLIDETAFGGR